MPNLENAVKELEHERDRVRSLLEGIDRAISLLYGLPPKGRTRTSRRMSQEAIARIRLAQKRRWTKWRKKHNRA